MQQRQKQTGFTVVELLIVIVVIAILAVVTIVAYNGIQDRAHASIAQAAARNVAHLLGASHATNGTYPSDLSTINNGGPLSTSDGTTYAYHPGSGNTSYCVTVTNGKSSFKVTDTNTTPTSGGCPGDGVGGVAAITNLITNPSIESGTSSLGGTNVSIARSTSWSSNGTSSVLVTPTSTTSRDSFVSVGGNQGGLRLGMQPGKTYTLSATLHIPVALTGTLTGGAPMITAWQYSGGGYKTSRDSAPNSPGTYPLRVTFTLANDATQAFIRLYHGGLSGSGVLYYDSIMLTEGSTVYSYADGNSPNWIWNGTANASTSTGPAP